MVRTRLCSLLAAGVIAAGSAILTAAPAQADKQTEKQIQAGCKEAGGTYSTTKTGGHVYSICDYKDNEGNDLTDSYVDGTYTGTCCSAAQAPANGRPQQAPNQGFSPAGPPPTSVPGAPPLAPNRGMSP